MPLAVDDMLAMLHDDARTAGTSPLDSMAQESVDDDYMLAELYAASAENAREFAAENAAHTRMVADSAHDIVARIEGLEQARGNFFRRAFDPLIELVNYDQSIAGQTAALRTANIKRNLAVETNQARRQQHADEQSQLQAAIDAGRYMREDALLDLSEDVQLNRDLIGIESDSEFKKKLKERNIDPSAAQTLLEQRLEFKETGRIREHTAAMDAFERTDAESAASLKKNLDLARIQDDDKFEEELRNRNLPADAAHDLRGIRGEFLHTSNTRKVQRLPDKELDTEIARGNQFAISEFTRRATNAQTRSQTAEHFRPIVLRDASIDELTGALEAARQSGTGRIGNHTFQLAELQEAFSGVASARAQKSALELDTQLHNDAVRDLVREIGQSAGTQFPQEFTFGQMVDSETIQGLPGPQRRTINSYRAQMELVNQRLESGDAPPIEANAVYASAHEGLMQTLQIYRETRIKQTPEEEQPAARQFFTDGIVSTGEFARNAVASALGPSFGTGSMLHDVAFDHVWNSFTKLMEDGEAAGDLQETIQSLQGREASEVRMSALNRMLADDKMRNQLQNIQAVVAFQEASKRYVDEYVSTTPDAALAEELLNVRTAPEELFRTIIQNAEPDVRRKAAHDLRMAFLGHYAQVVDTLKPHGPRNVPQAALNRIVWDNAGVEQLRQMGPQRFNLLALPFIQDDRSLEERDRDELRSSFEAGTAGFGFGF